MNKLSTILVTGGAGFLGTQVVAQLQEQGYQNVCIPRSSKYDLTEQSQVRALLNDVRPAVVIHLAAVVGGIGANRDNPGRYFYENLMMGIMMMEESRRQSIEKFVSVGTICAYPKLANIPFKEDDLWSGYPEETNAPYGLAKKMLLVQSQAYRAQYAFNSIHLMPVNLYGPGDNFDHSSSHVIPAMIRKFVEANESGESVILWGDGSPTREFLYVGDAARAIVLATERYDGNLPVNLGSGREISIAELAEITRKLVGYEGPIIWDTSKPNGQPRRKVDTSRAKREFGFESQIDFTEGIKATVDWYLNHKRAIAGRTKQ